MAAVAGAAAALSGSALLAVALAAAVLVVSAMGLVAAVLLWCMHRGMKLKVRSLQSSMHVAHWHCTVKPQHLLSFIALDFGVCHGRVVRGIVVPPDTFQSVECVEPRLLCLESFWCRPSLRLLDIFKQVSALHKFLLQHMCGANCRRSVT